MWPEVPYGCRTSPRRPTYEERRSWRRGGEGEDRLGAHLGRYPLEKRTPSERDEERVKRWGICMPPLRGTRDTPVAWSARTARLPGTR